MRWKISIEGWDEITRGQRFQFEIEKSLEDLAAGSLGLSIEEGKAIMASLQRHIVEQQCALYALFRRHCQGCGGTRPIKDYSTRTIQTVYGAITVESPRLYPCRRCMPDLDFTITPVSELCPDRATAELMTLTAKLGALMPYRAAAEVWPIFCQVIRQGGTRPCDIALWQSASDWKKRKNSACSLKRSTRRNEVNASCRCQETLNGNLSSASILLTSRKSAAVRREVSKRSFAKQAAEGLDPTVELCSPFLAHREGECAQRHYWPSNASGTRARAMLP